MMTSAMTVGVNDARDYCRCSNGPNFARGYYENHPTLLLCSFVVMALSANSLHFKALKIRCSIRPIYLYYAYTSKLLR
jgi:hypothetical protein